MTIEVLFEVREDETNRVDGSYTMTFETEAEIYEYWRRQDNHPFLHLIEVGRTVHE